jgi:hypothetical protein
MIHTFFVILRLFFHKLSVTLNTLLPKLGKTLHTSIVKFLASSWKHITKTLFQFVVICKTVSRKYILYRDKEAVVRGCQIWTVSKMGKNNPTYFCNRLTYAQAGARLDIVMKEKDVFHVSVRMDSTDALLKFV